MNIEEKFALAMILIKKQKKQIDNATLIIEAQDNLIKVQEKMINRYKEIFDTLRSSEEQS